MRGSSMPGDCSAQRVPAGGRDRASLSLVADGATVNGAERAATSLHRGRRTDRSAEPEGTRNDPRRPPA